jgi:hypothetical protein
MNYDLTTPRAFDLDAFAGRREIADRLKSMRVWLRNEAHA